MHFWTQLSWSHIRISINYLTGELAWKNDQPLGPLFRHGMAGRDLGHHTGIWQDGLGALARARDNAGALPAFSHWLAHTPGGLASSDR